MKGRASPGKPFGRVINGDPADVVEVTQKLMLQIIQAGKLNSPNIIVRRHCNLVSDPISMEGRS